MDGKSIRNIGIVAHVDAGKTTITEEMLALSGMLRKKGSVDKGSAHTDFLAVERERGISVKSALTNFRWKGVRINLIDTPGHVDFSSEVERSLAVLDGVVLVVSAVEGIQSHTETLWHAITEMNLPMLIVVNKIDRIGADPEGVVFELKKRFSGMITPIQETSDTETSSPKIQNLIDLDNIPDSFIESMCECDDVLLSRYLEGNSISKNEVSEVLKKATHSRKLIPLLFASSLKGVGIDLLLDSIVSLLPPPQGESKGELSGLIFKIQNNSTFGRMAFVRLFNGSIRNRDTIFNATSGKEEKVAQIKDANGDKLTDLNEAGAASIAVLTGLRESSVGDVLGSNNFMPTLPSLGASLLRVEVKAVEEERYADLASAIEILSMEEPTLNFDWFREERKLFINILGKVQVETIQYELEERFGITTDFGPPEVIYMETPSQEGFGFDAYTMPKPCWAVVKFLIEPGKRGSGIVYRSEVSVDKIAKRYQNEVERAIYRSLKQGVLGWEVTDINITLVDGEDHVMHSNPGDFLLATPMAILSGLKSIGTTLLEPMLKFRITAPEHISGRLIGDLISMRADFENPVVSSDKISICGKIPVSTSLEYPIRLASLSGGTGKMVTSFAGYRECELENGKSRQYRGISPLDRSKFILHMRKAL